MGAYQIIKKLLKRLNIQRVSNAPLSSDNYYSHLFIENGNWNKAVPNTEEATRWQIIESFLLHIKKLHLQSEEKLKILDLGCGRGWLTNLLANYGDVIGIEPVKQVVDYGKKLFPDLDLQYGTAKDLLLQGQADRYDIVVCSEVIEHIPDNEKPQFLAEINTLLKTDGFVIITTPRKEAEQEWGKYGTPDQPVEDWISEDTLQKILITNNFEKHLLSRFSVSPVKNAPEIEIYQLWLARKIK